MKANPDTDRVKVVRIVALPERDFIDVRRRVVVYDGGMGATLEQFDLTAEDYGGLPESATRRWSSGART